MKKIAVLAMAALLPAAAAPGGEDAARAMRSAEDMQVRIGLETERISDALRAALEEIAINSVGVRHRGRVEDGSVKLDRIGREKSPRVVERIRFARSEAGKDEQRLRLAEAAQEEEAILRELKGLVDAAESEMSPSRAEEIVGNLAAMQAEAQRALREARERNPEMEGRQSRDLRPQETQDLRTASARQQAVSDAIRRAAPELRSAAAAVRPTDPAEADRIDRALAVMDRERAGDRSEDAGRRMLENRLRSAEAGQDDVAATLNRARNELRGRDPAEEAAARLAGLRRARDAQDSVRGETGRLDRATDGGRIDRAAADQDDVARAVGRMSDERPEDGDLRAALAGAESASSALHGRDPEGAQAGQRSALGALDRAIARAEGDLDAARVRQDAPGRPDQAANDRDGEANRQREASRGDGNRSRQVIAAGFRRGRAGDVAGTWDVNLPPKERAEVEQARRTNFPEGYARMLRLYYRNLGVESR